MDARRNHNTTIFRKCQDWSGILVASTPERDNLITASITTDAISCPRIKNFKDQQLYSFESPPVLKANGYAVLPKKRINAKIIQEQWDYILRLITTIKLKEVTASQLFKRLSSYSRQHPLYQTKEEQLIADGCVSVWLKIPLFAGITSIFRKKFTTQNQTKKGKI